MGDAHPRGAGWRPILADHRLSHRWRELRRQPAPHDPVGSAGVQRQHSVLGADMETDWYVPSELPDLRRVGLLAIDSEERDGGLATERGSGWPWGDGHVCGISVAYHGDGQVHGLYVPMRHPDTQNFAPEQVYAWLKDHVASDLRFITH